MSKKQDYKIHYEDINLTNIKEGQIFNSYIEFCEALGIQAKSGGDSRKAQKEQLSQYIYFESVGKRQFKIIEIYAIPKIKEDKRKEGNNTVYRENLITILSRILLKSKCKTYLCSRGVLAEELGITNKNYRKARVNICDTARKLKIPEEYLFDFYMINGTKIVKNIDSSLDYYEKEDYFRVTKATAVCIKSPDGRPDVHRLATEEEDRLIMECRDKVKKEMNIKHNIEIMHKHLWNIFNDKVVEEIQKCDKEILYYYKAYYFTAINEAKLRKRYSDKKSKVQDLKKEVNQTYKESSYKSAEKRHDKSIKRLEKGEGNKFSNERDTLLSSSSFVENSMKLSDTLICQSAKTMRFPKPKELNKESNQETFNFDDDCNIDE